MSKELVPATDVMSHAGVLVAIERSDLAPSTKMKYRRAIEAYLATGSSLTDAEALASYAAELPASGRAFLKAAVSKWAAHMVNQVKARPAGDPGEVLMKQEAIYRFEALQNAISVRQPNGSKAHIWLTPAEVRRLMALPGDDVAGRRDRVALGLLVAAGLRRREAVQLAFDDVKLQPVRERLRTVLDVAGKGSKQRQVPISDQLAAAIDAWGAHVEGKGPVLRSVSPAGRVGESLSAVGLFKLVQRYGAEIGRPELAPHDLRRTYAQIGYESGVPITQISKLLGHATVATTQRYLNLDLDLTTTVSDFVPM
jgi:site-specific recombinase XerC